MENDRIKELQSQILALTEQNEKMREALQHYIDHFASGSADEYTEIAQKALSITQLPSLNLYRAKEKVIEAARRWIDADNAHEGDWDRLQEALSLLAKVEKSSSQERK